MQIQGIIAMAGLAEAAEFLGMLIFMGILLVTFGLLILACWKRSLIAVLIACVLVLTAGLLIDPSAVFSAKPSANNDPDAVHWQAVVWLLLTIWALLVIATIGCLIWVIRQKIRKKRTQILIRDGGR